MPEEKDKIKKLYDTFVSDGYDMESEEDFRKNLLDSTKRKAAYDALVKDGYDMEPFEEFESNIGFGKERTSSQQSGNSASGTVEEPISPANEQTWQPTEKEKVAMLTETDRIMNDVKSHTQTFNERIDNMQEYGINPGLQTKEGKMIFNPESGKLERTFLTPTGNRYYSKSLADMESFQYRQAADMSIGGQLRKANLRLQELKAKQAERASEVHKEWAEETENNKAPLAAILGAATYTPRQQSDKENHALSVAIRETEELIKNLEEQKDRENGVDVGFWRGFGRTMGDVRTWDFGMGDMRDAFTMMNADELKKENATEGEREAHDAMMGAIHEKQQAEERYSGNADFWNRAGVMTGYMPSFMLDFVLTGGGFNGLSSFSKGSTKLATKVISKETAEKMAQQGFKSYIKENGAKGLGRYVSDWTIKALGTTADDLLVRAPLMANTVQAGKTTADIIDRKLGDVVVDENGNYDFSNDKTWGDAIWQSEANAIIENYSEMFGAHLDPVFTLGNMSKLANVLGAKRIGAVLSKADASALNGIMGQTHQMFNKMGVSDYVGEVSEEYYGQLWRTMLNLDDAYQQNPDGTRTNLFASGQFHGDIWGGMALSMGLMGAGKHTLSAANYTSMKHGVNKADAKVNELLGKEVWEPLKATLDLTTNENIGEVAELIAGDKDFTINEKAAVLDYMERSLNLRGFNLASMAQSRGGNRNESVQQANDSYLDGYNIISSQEMNDAKNMYEYQRARVADLVDESMFAMIEENPIAALEFVNGNEQWNDEDKVSVIDYINAKQVYNGMIQRVRDDIDGRIEQSNSMIDARVNHNTGMIQGATMKQDERKVYVISGKLVPYDDGSGVSVTDSDNSIIIRDSETGALEQVSPDTVLSLDESQDPNEQKELAEQAIVEQFAREAADKIDGKVTFNSGDAYTITGQDGSQMQVQVIANEDGIVDNGDGTVNVSDGVNIFPLAKETIQQQADAANLARVAQFEQQRTIENAERKQEMQEAERPQYALNDIVSLTDENGVTVRGNITADADADGKYEVFTEAPINGKRVNLFTRDELDNMLLEHNGVAFEHPAENESNNGAENIPENDNNAPQNIPAMQRIPKDEQGDPLYEQADSDTAWDAIVEQTEGDEDMAQTVADGMVADKEEALKKLEKAKSKGGNSIAEKIASEKERKAAIDAAKQELLVWQKIAGTAKRRKMEADDERRRIADEAAALRKAEEEKLRAEREEAERIEREALNGVPDMVDDKPQDARARGYRRMNGHKIDRQEPVQALQGKEVSVKFSDDAIVGGRVAVIDVNLLQPSHIQGVRNPLHFIDEAQPKERNDEASVLSARKIAGDIRPEEITSSVTAYTGAPTVNARGEAIQGNNRSDALRIMWENHPEQAALYKQYLKDHAEEFGLQAEDIEAMEHPVLVNMVDVDDAEAIRLGQYVAQDTESGGVERIKPKNALQRMGAEMRSFANLLLRTSDDEMSFAGLVDSNGANVLKWMSQRGFITPTQYKSAFDSKGNLTPESKNDLRGIMYQSIFKDGSTRLEEMFNVLPVKAQKAILATAFRDYDSPNSERMVDEIQNSVRAYYALSQDKMFAEAKNFKEARTAIESWKRQYQMDDVTGESYLPADNFSNFVLHLAAMYKGESQSFIQNTFGKIYDLIQGTQEETLFEQPDNTPRTLVQAIKEALNLDYNGQQRSNVLVGDTATSQRGQQGSNGTLAPRERVENRNGTTDDTGRTESIGGQSEIESSLSQEEMLFSDDTDNQLSAKIARRIEVQEDDWIESGKYGDTYKQTIIVDGTHKVIKVDAPDTKGNYIGSAYEYDSQTFGDLLDVLNYIDASLSLANAVAVAEKETDTTPTEKQKEAGNYKKGHVQVGTFNITIENPKGSVRSGIDTEGNKWETTMQNTYGYIRGTEGVDGDHIDVFLSDDIDGWNGRRVFVVDQYNEDGSFDEHKVMLGFNETDDAEAAYFANYDSDWANNHKTVVTAVNLENFEKWIDSSHRKTKAFAEYKSVKSVEEQSSGTQVDRLSEIKSRIEELHKEQEAAHGQSDIFEEARIISEINDLFAGQRKLEQSNSNEETTTPTDAAYTITPAQYTTKRGKVLDMHLVKFNNELRDTVRKHTTMFAKQLKGWWNKEKQGFMMRSKEDAERLAEYATDAQSQPPLSLSDLSEVNDGNVQFAESQLLETSKQEEKQEYSPVWQYSVSVDKKTGLTTLKRDDVSGPIPIGDGRFNYTANSPEEMLEIVRNPKNFNQELRDAVETILENKVKIREIVRTEKAEATEQESKPENNPSGNRLVTDERYAELRERMRKKLLGQMNMGIDPEILAIGTEMAVYHLEKGARKFTEYATAMVADLGDSIRPYLKAFYNGARDLPEVAENGLDADMTPYDEVQQFDVTNFDKKSIDALATAETVTRETEVEQEAEIAQERIKKSRPARKKNEKKAVISQQSNELGLFDALTDNNKNSEHGLQRTDAERSERVPAKGYRHEQGLSRGTETGSESEQQAGRGTDNEGERTGDAVDRTVRPRLSDSLNEQSIEGKRKKEIEKNRKLADELKGVTLHLNDKLGGEHEISGIVYYELANVFHCNDNISGPFQAIRKELDAILKVARKNDGRNTFTPKNTHNNHSERGKDHAPTSVDARIEANIKAIELAKQLLESGEQATEKQMQTLRKFSGWGGLGKAFNEGTSYASNPIAKKLRELLGEKAYQEAIMSANSAYYTPAYVVDTLWDIAEQMGFNGGNILEGSAGIGNILGQMPTNISERSDIHAIEIDRTSGGILSLLYPDAKVEIQGFEQTRIPNGSVDLAITNVPFVTGLRVNDTTGDKDLSKKFHNIHDFCIAKNVRKLREGGLGIFITSNGTLDNSKKLRDWIVNEGGSDFVGAFRMHNKTFGGTGVTSDIVVIRKRVNGQKSAHVIDVSDVSGERMAEYDTGETRKVKGKETPVIKQLSMDYNRYFIEHPENMAGEMHFAFEKGDTFRPTSKGLYPAQDKKQEQMLSKFVHSFKAEEFGERNAGPVTDVMPDKKIGEIFIRDGKLFINSTASAQPLEVNANKVKGHTKVECFEAYTAIKEALAEVLSYQTENESDEGLKPLLDKLNKAYDDFVGTYGHFNKNTAIAFLRNDVDYANVFALEKFEETADEKGNRIQKFEKTDVFSKRVVEKDKEPTPANVKDGIIASIFKFGRVDIPYIAEQLGTGIENVKKEIIESGYGFEDPVSRQMEASYQYLSGNIREKLRQAEENNENGEFDRNIKALQEVMPMEIPAHLIDFTLGSSWIDPKLYEDFVKERTEVDVRFTAVGGTWFMKEPYFTNYEKNRAMGVTSEMLGRTIMGHTLIEAAIQNRSITVSTTKKHYDGTTETITDKEATQACAAKIDEIRQDFKDWARQKMQSDPEMSERMERIYNDMFNNFVPMSIPDEFVPEYFGGASHKFKMRPHQGRAIVRGTQQPLLLAHEVGTGKTFTLISTAMEMRRLGTARKPMIVVQNATVGQFVASAKELYPNAKILTLEEADRSAEGRKNFYAKIRYNDWDMIVVPQSTFEFIPDSEEREMTFVQDKIEEKMLILEQMKEEDPDGKNMITRQAEREIELLEEQLAGLADNASKKRTANDEKKRAVALQNAEVKAMEMLDRRTDDVENFDDMGIDALLVDEAHEYKHLGFATAMQRGVKGVDPSYSKKSQGVFLKTQAVLEKNNGRNVIFATGTPISNTAAEIWTFMRYLMPADTMKEYGIYYFDDFVRNFGNIQQMLEFTTSGKFKENNRFAGYVNLPELVRIWSGVSDTVLTKEAGGVKDKIPEMEGGKAQDLYLPQTRALRSIMKFVKSELEHYEQMSGKEKKENSHIPLTMYGIAKAAAVDARLVQSDAEDDQNSKTNEAVRQTLRSLKETADYKGTVAIFADNYQNKQSGFNLYDDIRNKLIAEGVPADEIVVMRSGMTVKKKLEIFEKVNRGEVRVILGSTFTLGTGVNIQERLHTLIHLDAPNRPMDYTQRNGRILRQGNLHKDMNKPVRILRFGVEDSLDVTAYQRLKTKGAIADSIMNGKQMMNNSMTNRVLEEEEDVFGDTVAQLSGSEYAMLKNNAEKNVRKYASRKKQWETDQTYIHNAKPRLKAFIKDAEKRIEDNGRYLEAVRSLFPDGQFKEIVTGKHRFASVDTMDDFFKEHNKSILAEMKQMKDGEISGEQKRELIIQIGDFSFVVTTKLTRKTMSDGATLFNDVERRMTYSCLELGIVDVPVRQNLLRNAIENITDNVITGKDFAERLSAGERSKKHNEAELEELLSREGKPFEYEEELAQAKAQLEEYAELMKKELEEKEAKYAEMDASVETANDITNTDEDDVLYRSDDTMYRIREDAAPQNTGIGYKVFVLKNGELYPPMVANPNGEATPVGVWLDADAAPIAGQSKTGRNQVKAGGKGTQGGSGKLAYRPGWHLGVIPYALQFNRIDENGDKTLFPANFVWAEVEYANDVDYQEEAMSYGYNKNGKFQHSYAGLPRIPENGAYTYRTNPNPETDPWIITGAMRVKRLLTPSEVDEMVKEAGREPQRRQENAVTDAEIAALNAEIANDYRNGIGTYTDDEVSYENDPVAKLLGQSRRTAKQRREFAQRERQRMAERVESLAEKLHLDNVEVVTDASVLDGKKQRAKGFYSKSTGKITIVIPNHTSTFDVEQTLLHEAVAHYGLRQLFGEHFDTFLDNVFNNADENIRRRIVDMAAKNGWDFHKATEEYLASLAEDTEFENINASWWQQIKDFFLNMLHKIGFEDFRGVTLSDNELRYILWRSYENLAEPGRYRNILGEAADVAKQYELKVGNYAVSDPHHQTVAESDDALYRTGDPEIHERELARDRYERRVKSGMFQSQEALQDSMLGLKEAMTAILGKETNIEDVDGFENAYLGENRLSSVNKAEADAFAHTLFKPMLDEVAKLARTEAEREELTDYMMVKHGLERNTYMRNEAINNGATDADQTDYAGLTSLTGMDNVTDAETEAQIMVNDYEQAHDTTDLWKKVNAASKAILSKSYECGMMSKATFDKISDMYDFYIPLRGFDEKTSSEAYAYLTHKQSAFNAPIKKAEGRRSKADDPFANLQSMAEGAIMQGNRNKLVKQRFLNFALNHSSDLVSVSDIWVEYDTVADEWKPVFPDNIDSTDTPEVVERKMLDFETKMESLAQQYPDRYKHGKDTVNIPYRIVESRDMRQHQIVVKRGGRDYVITINGNPRAAQALNGQTNPDNDMSGAIGAILRAGENINRQLSAFYTTRNPDFIVSNFMRDMLYTNTMTWIRESPNYALRFHRNYMYANPVRIKQLLAKHRKGTLDMSNKTEAMFHQFMMNGGETGYANIRDIEQHKNDIRRELKKSNGKIPVKKAWDLLGERFDEYNRAVENCARFAAFMTSREMGRSIDRAIYDAKEISVNFNKKGSGAKFYNSTGQTKAGNASALVSGLGRSGYVFWNAAIQGTANFGRQMKRHPAKAFTGIAAMFLLGAIVAYLGGDDDDDDDKNAYYNLPEYVRRSNILFRAGNSWVSIPLPVEYRAVYGMGELMISVLNGKEHLTGEEIAEAITGQATQILPIDFLEGGGGLNAFVPSAYKPLWEAYVAEKSWTGMPLYKDTPYNKDMPEWTKAYKSANKYIVGLANAMNEATGGDPYTKGTIDFNPAKIEYMLNGYFGGVFGTIDKLSKTAETITDNREYDPRSFLLVNRLVKAGDERTEYRAVNNEYFRLKEEHDRLKSRLKHYEEDTDNDIFDYAEKIDFLYNSPEYERYEIFEDYRRDIDDLYNELNDTVDDEERKNIEAELNELKKEMIEEMNKTRK
ncbi:helicase-related protein [Bacteroides thetaiotaomicron]|uniref:LPD38 domain-containing protein n=1 Tax=Bacteroidaceae TaxID=815 RepID=UPI001E399173|nr:MULTISPECIES: LPD38 domain-containing protein [Bacteroidaceae]MDC2241426.1 helicase-related protein [Bacteroides thetaiotaomicron]